MVTRRRLASGLTARASVPRISCSSHLPPPEWWNWQTRTFEGRVEKSMRVRVPPPAPFLTLRRTSTRAISDMPSTPLFAFGHGLSYTTFEYAPLKLASDSVDVGGEARVSLTVTNTGKRRGTEIVQLYAADTATGVTRPAQQLIGFARVELGARRVEKRRVRGADELIKERRASKGAACRTAGSSDGRFVDKPCVGAYWSWQPARILNDSRLSVRSSPPRRAPMSPHARSNRHPRTRPATALSQV